MAWEKRDGKTYYYRSVRREGRACKVYCGSGAAGKKAEEEDLQRRANREQLKQQEMLAAWRVEKVERQMAHQLKVAQLLTEACLLAMGLRRRKREPWSR